MAIASTQYMGMPESPAEKNEREGESKSESESGIGERGR